MPDMTQSEIRQNITKKIQEVMQQEKDQGLLDTGRNKTLMQIRDVFGRKEDFDLERFNSISYIFADLLAHRRDAMELLARLKRCIDSEN
jgi:hypothetical protein